MSALLSFENAPPLSVPARFLVTAPWYGVLAGLLLLAEGSDILLSRWSPSVLALTHLLTVGVLMQVMIGALFQFLPVAADAGIENPRRPAMVIHGALNGGALLLVAGFYFSRPLLLALAGGLLALAIGVFVLLAGRALWPKRATSPTIPALKLALAGLLVTAGFGLVLLGVYGFGMAGRVDALTAQHAAWGLIGWSGMLIVGVAYVVVPMFQLTPGYSKRVGKTLAPALFVLLLLWTAAQAAGLPLASGLAGAGLAVTLGVFAAITLGLQGRSKRAEADTTFLFWRLGMLCALLAGGLWAAWPLIEALFASRGLPQPLVFALGVLAIAGVLLSVIGGMLYKILPFLCWLHLQQLGMENGIVKTPHMGVFLAEQRMRRQFYWHNAMLALLLAMLVWPALAPVAGVATAGSFGLLGANLLSALRTLGRQKALLLAKAKLAA